MKIIPYVSLAEKTTFGCGGKARWFCEVEDMQTFINLIKLHKNNFYILGGGSKTICSDNGYDGLVISTQKLSKIYFDNHFVCCECGAMLSSLQKFCLKNNLTGLEWACGIPASVGGMVVMNAGAFGHEVAESIEKVEILENNKQKILFKNDINFSYRNSSLKSKVVLRIWLNLKKDDKNKIEEKQKYFYNQKQNSQPICKGSAGSIFKRSQNVIPAKIIDKLGLKGVKIGGAEISIQHCGFIINNGTATATDVINLIEFIKNKVKDETDITLENEIIILE